MKKLILLFMSVSLLNANAQSIHQEQSQYYGSLGIADSLYPLINNRPVRTPDARTSCALNKMVYGWHPYWSNGLEVNYDWSMLSHFCYFSYELDANTGNAVTTHGFSTATSVTTALSNGVKVNLCVTLFSNHTTFLTSTTSRQNLINNLISLVSSRGAHGVNIDFEGLPLSQKANFTSFMNDLADQMHAAIPGSEISSVLYAVDWSEVIDVAAMTSVDYFIIMGYDYYWTGSATAGPNDPLYQFGTSYNYTLSRSVTFYLNKGLDPSRLLLGLPYYGREWSVASTGIPASTTGSGVSRTFTYVKDNTSGNYSTANRYFDNQSYSAYYQFSSGGTKQCFITEAYEMGERLDFIRKRGIAGMGIWALGYDDGYNDFWETIRTHLSDCTTDLCLDTLFDIGGGPNKNYYDNEDYTYTISPPGASQITVNFSAFNVESGYDFLYVYDGNSTTSPQFPGSPFTGTVSPGVLTSSGGSVTFRFVSDGSTTSSGFKATYQCLADTLSPATDIVFPSDWQTANFTVNFTDTDDTYGSGVNQKFYQVMDFDGVEWRANSTHGFFNDNFTSALHTDWTTGLGTWSISLAQLKQASNTEANTNVYANLVQDNTKQYLYHWKMNMTGTGTNRRAGIHFFCDNPTLPNRGNSYFVYFRVDSDRCQIYEVISDTYYLMTDDAVVVNPNTVYDCKVYYDPVSGTIRAYLNDNLVSEWVDTTPLVSGNSISLRTGNTSTYYDDVKVYVNRGSSANVSVGSSSAMVRYQNYGLLQPSCKVASIVNDNLYNWSAVTQESTNIDWTNPSLVAAVTDSLGGDIDAQIDSSQLAGEYTLSSDLHSSIAEYWYSVGVSPGDSSVIGWTNNSTNTFFSRTGLALTYGQTYYVNVKAKNGAGLWSSVASSDGVTIVEPTQPPVCSFSLPVLEVCANEMVTLNNTTTGANTYTWSCAGAMFSDSTLQYPQIGFSSSGAYNVQLIAVGPGGADTLVQIINITTYAPPVAVFTVNNDTLNLPSAYLACTNASTDATLYEWSFGDGNVSTDVDPWNIYTVAGIYEVSLIANNGYCPQDTSMITVVVNGAIGVQEIEKNNIVQLYPNPATTMVTLLCNKQYSTVQVYDAVGKQMAIQLNKNEGTVSFNVANFESGLYTVVVCYNEHDYVEQKFVKR